MDNTAEHFHAGRDPLLWEVGIQHRSWRLRFSLAGQRTARGQGPSSPQRSATGAPTERISAASTRAASPTPHWGGLEKQLRHPQRGLARELSGSAPWAGAADCGWQQPPSTPKLPALGHRCSATRAGGVPSPGQGARLRARPRGTPPAFLLEPIKDRSRIYCINLHTRRLELIFISPLYCISVTFTVLK